MYTHRFAHDGVEVRQGIELFHRGVVVGDSKQLVAQFGLDSRRLRQSVERPCRCRTVVLDTTPLWSAPSWRVRGGYNINNLVVSCPATRKVGTSAGQCKKHITNRVDHHWKAMGTYERIRRRRSVSALPADPYPCLRGSTVTTNRATVSRSFQRS